MKGHNQAQLKYNKKMFTAKFPFVLANYTGRNSSEYVKRIEESTMPDKEGIINNYLNLCQHKIINHYNG